MRPEGFCRESNPATFRLLGQCLNQLHHRVPPLVVVVEIILVVAVVLRKCVIEAEVPHDSNRVLVQHFIRMFE